MNANSLPLLEKKSKIMVNFFYSKSKIYQEGLLLPKPELGFYILGFHSYPGYLLHGDVLFSVPKGRTAILKKKLLIYKHMNIHMHEHTCTM